MRAVFLDRDGVINENADRGVISPEQFRFLPRVEQALARLAASPFKVIVVTNQSVVGRRRMPGALLQEIHADMRTQVQTAGGRIDAIYVCTHRPTDGCICRKPETGLLRRAAADWDLQLEASYLVGDAITDVQAALAVGCQPILVSTGRGLQARAELARQQIRQYWVAADLADAVTLILRLESAAHGASRCA